VAAAQRIDWQAIKARWNTETGVFHLAVLPKGAAQLFLAICDRLHWQATYRIEGYDFADWDELQRIVDLGIAGLTDTMRLSDLIAHVDDVEALLRQIRDRPCCGESFFDPVPNPNEGGGTITPIGPEEELPNLSDENDLFVNPPITPWTDANADETVSQAEMEDYLCRAFNWYYDLLMRWLSYIKVYAQLGSFGWDAINAIIPLVLSRYKGVPNWVTMTVEIADALFTLWPDITEAIADSLINEFQENRSEIICSLAGATSMAEIWNILSAQIETSTAALGYASLSAIVSWPTFALALASQGMIDLEGISDECTCTVDSVTYTFDESEAPLVYKTYPGLVDRASWYHPTLGNPPGAVRTDSTMVVLTPAINAPAHTRIRITADVCRNGYGSQRMTRVHFFDSSMALIGTQNLSYVSTPDWNTRTAYFTHSGSGTIYVGLTGAGPEVRFDNVTIAFETV